MKYEIEGQQQEKEKTLTFGLVKYNDEVRVIVADENGDKWFLVSFHQNGQTYRCTPVPSRLNFDMDGPCIKVL